MTISRVAIDPTGDIDLAIRGHRFIVSSLKMSEISPTFRQVFENQDYPSLKTVTLPNEDPATFLMICQSAHGHFIPQSYISLEILANMADAIRRYDIPNTCSIHEIVQFCFEVRTGLPGTVSIPNLSTLLEVAKVLGSTVLIRLLEDTFFLRPFFFEALPIEPELSYVKMQGAVCRVHVVNTLLRSVADPRQSQRELYDLVLLILFKGLSLYQISTRLDQATTTGFPDRPQHLLDAHGVIERAASDLRCHLRREAKAQQSTRDESLQQVPVRLSQKFNRLEVQTAYSEEAAYSISSPATVFEDIDAYPPFVDEIEQVNSEFEDTASILSREMLPRRRNTT